MTIRNLQTRGTGNAQHVTADLRPAVPVRAYTAGLGVYIVEQHEVTLPMVIEILSAPRLEVRVALSASSAMNVELVGNNVGGPAGDAAYEFSKLF
jgi:hypothetical protein